jgi:hypothetical protein
MKNEELRMKYLSAALVALMLQGSFDSGVRPLAG